MSLIEQRKEKTNDQDKGNFIILCMWQQSVEAAQLVNKELLTVGPIAHTTVTHMEIEELQRG